VPFSPISIRYADRSVGMELSTAQEIHAEDQVNEMAGIKQGFDLAERVPHPEDQNRLKGRATRQVYYY
jgi:hypothetical protein